MRDIHDDTIEAMRGFNRYYTSKLGVVGRGYLSSGYTLAEARIIYEIGARGDISATELCRELDIDPAYLSRILKKFRESGLVETRPDPADKRAQVLSMTESGMHTHHMLGERSREQIGEMLSPLSEADRQALAKAFSTIRRLIDPDKQAASPAIIRTHRPGDIGWIVQSQAEFYTRMYGWNDQFEALVADVAGKFLANFDALKEACWIAERDGIRVGSIMLVNGGDGVAKLRLLYVDEAARGTGLGKTLVEECIRFARSKGYERVSLWTNDVLHPARRIYEQAGFRLVTEERHSMFGKPENGQTWELAL